MRKKILLSLVILAGFCCSNLASAQRSQIEGKIPFDFNAGSAQLSAGVYRITYADGMVTVRNLESGNSVMLLAVPENAPSNGNCYLNFVHYGNRYILKQSACRAINANFFIPTSLAEKKSRELVASNSDGLETVVPMK